ncbi:ribokinase [Luteitalea sp.]
MPRIAVVGSLNMDLVVVAPRFAQPGETVAGDRFFTVPGGKGANQAVAAQRLGGQVAMIGGVGEDAFGATMTRALADEGIDVRHVDVRAGHASGVALITVDAAGENTIIVVAGANGTLTPDDVTLAREAIEAADVLLLQLEIPMAVVLAAARTARDAGRIVILNAAPAAALPDALVPLIDYLVVNETELFAIAGDAAHDQPSALAALRVRGAGAVVVTLGAAGARLEPREGPASLVRAYVVDVVDTTAAGDAFVGAFAVALAEGRPAVDALRRGNAAGALTVTRAGAQPAIPTRADVDAWLAERLP